MPRRPDGIMGCVEPVHWDEVDGGDLGRAAGAVVVSLRRTVVAPGGQVAPADAHAAEEAFLFVLCGSGRSAGFELHAGDALLRRPGADAHPLVAGDDGLDVLAFGIRASEPTLVAGPSQRVVSLADVALARTERRGHRLTERELGDALGSELSTLSHMTIDAGSEGFPPHCHSAEEELFVILAGAGALLLGDQQIRVGPGHVFACPPRTGVPHSLRAGAHADLVYLNYGNLDAADLVWYPRSKKVAFRGVGVIARVDPLDYWDGEE